MQNLTGFFFYLIFELCVCQIKNSHQIWQKNYCTWIVCISMHFHIVSWCYLDKNVDKNAYKRLVFLNFWLLLQLLSDGYQTFWDWITQSFFMFLSVPKKDFSISIGHGPNAQFGWWIGWSRIFWKCSFSNQWSISS